MTLFAKVIDSLHVKLVRSGYRKIVTPSLFDGQVMQLNCVIQLLKGSMRIGKQEIPVKERSLVFLPAGKPVYIKYGSGGEYARIGKDDASENPEKVTQYLMPVNSTDPVLIDGEAINFVAMDVLLYHAVSLFEMMDIEAFIMPYDEEMAFLINRICLESEEDRLGKDRLMDNYINELVMLLCRHIKSHPDLDHNVEKLKYLSDKRLIDIIQYIQANLEKDLSNKTIAGVAYISEDYVGQFFMTHIGLKLQDYIENQRLEYAHKLLRSNNETIQEISHQVGFKDPAYFSRRFKMKYGIKANQARGEKNYMV